MKARRKLMAYVWEGVLCDWTCGMAVAVAYSADEAREKLTSSSPLAPSTDDLAGEPTVMEVKDLAVSVSGGG